ncbi:hypothetical protein [Duganella sp. BuS-21]|uniref:hypothetical protein n=1 Tax=Duganella sp. BuS-21 TaxID=2943848 RepID=UPI0035A6FBB9
MSFDVNGKPHDCAHGCTSLAEHSERLSAEAYVDRFENHLEDYVGDVASVIVLSGTAAAAKHSIQALVNAYHDLGRKISPLTAQTPAHFNILQMFVLITGASLEHSGQNEGLKILEQAGAGKANG